MLAVGVDIGGTFTDIVCLGEDGHRTAAKVPTTPDDRVRGVRQAVEKVLALAGRSPGEVRLFAHGSTVATNAILERRGATIGLLTTAGFEDTLEIGRQKGGRMYDLNMDLETPAFLAPRRRRIGIPERIAADGSALIPLDEGAVRAAIRRLVQEEGIEALAVCYLFAFRNPVHEQRTRAIALKEAPNLKVSLASEIDPVFREYERTCVTVFDAYLRPVTEAYMARLEEGLRGIGVSAPVLIMQSRGGLSSVQRAVAKPVTMFLSGPAAGAIGGKVVGEQAGFPNVITLDIGGTSCDIALIEAGRPLLTREGRIAGYPVRIPMVDVNTVGAGGGSIAWLDAGGGLRVGPQSAGAVPGPACYDQGGREATVTDASLVLGYLNPDYFAGGAVKLDPGAAREAVGRIGAALGLDLVTAAAGIHRVVNARMAEEIRLVTVKRGYDPRRFGLVALGGAGPVHAPALARELEIPTVIVPDRPGVLSAFGLLVAPIEHEHARTFAVKARDVDPAAMAALYATLDAEGRGQLRRDRIRDADVTCARAADMRYVGQGYELEVPCPDGELTATTLAAMIAEFHRRHAQVYGYSNPSDPVEFVNLRTVHATAPPRPPVRPPVRGGTLADAHKGSRRACFAPGAGFLEVRVYERDLLPTGAEFPGPALVDQPDSTVVIPPDFRCEVSATRHLLLRRA